MTLSKLYSLPVERVDGKRRGYILAVLREGDSICCLCCADENEREFFVSADKIVRASDRIIYGTECAKKARKNVLRLNLPCYDERGKFLGYAEDYILSALTLKSCRVNGKSYPADRVCCTDVAVLRDKNNTPAAIAAKDMFLEAVVGSAPAGQE